MSLARFRLSHASRVERQVIEALRSSLHGGTCRTVLGPQAEQAIRALALCADARGLWIWPVDAGHVSEDEIGLVGSLCLLQRDSTDGIVIDSALLDALRSAADALKETHRLPHLAVIRARLAAGRPASPAARPATGSEHAGRPPVMTTGQTRRARAIAFARSQGRVSTKALCSLGLSRQYVRMLCLTGALIRVRHGIYAAPNPTVAIAAN